MPELHILLLGRCDSNLEAIEGLIGDEAYCLSDRLMTGPENECWPPLMQILARINPQMVVVDISSWFQGSQAFLQKLQSCLGPGTSLVVLHDLTPLLAEAIQQRFPAAHFISVHLAGEQLWPLVCRFPDPQNTNRIRESLNFQLAEMADSQERSDW